jgi:flagellar biosynthetic protein FlhB
MADVRHQEEKTEQATPRRLEEAWKKGQFARSAEVQTVFVLFGAVLALLFTGPEVWRNLTLMMAGSLGHLHDTPLKFDGLQRFSIDACFVAGACVWPVLAAAAVGGLLASAVQSRFRTAPDAL